MHGIFRRLILWFLLGEQYFVMEAVYRAFYGGRAHIAMLAVGGLCGFAVGSINQITRFYRAPVVLQSLIGTGMTLAAEFLSGYILNICMGLAIWDYSGLPGNIMGQICLPFALVWLLMMPLAIWLEDRFRWLFWREGTPYKLTAIYRDFIIFWRKPLAVWTE